MQSNQTEHCMHPSPIHHFVWYYILLTAFSTPLAAKRVFNIPDVLLNSFGEEFVKGPPQMLIAT